MARTQSINDGDLIARLSGVFRREGFAGASLADLAAAAGLRKASLYHRFPRGKEQMAEEALQAALAWYGSNILEPLSKPGAPREKLARVTQKLDEFYDGGRQACLLNMLASSTPEASPFGPAIRSAFLAVTDAFAQVAVEAGATSDAARRRAERMLALLHGSLVVSRGSGTGEPFRVFLSTLADELLGDRA
ncbi:MAG: TetR family transcriptional regulator [Beijerinckiaceae bacterium]